MKFVKRRARGFAAKNCRYRLLFSGGIPEAAGVSGGRAAVHEANDISHHESRPLPRRLLASLLCGPVPS